MRKLPYGEALLHDKGIRERDSLSLYRLSGLRRYAPSGAASAKRLESEGDSKRAGQVRALFREELKKEFYYSAYAACFSLHRDDAAQWERYGNRGRGVCIAFQGM